MKQLQVPQFKNEDEERRFWSRTDLTKYFTAGDFDRVSFPSLKPTSRSVSIRVPEYLLMRIKEQANALNVPYQSLIKKYIAEGTLEK
jgi:predicted DNA binding CopG/RHH family protein